MDPRLTETWLRMLADGVRGKEDVRRALESLGTSPPSQTNLSSWMGDWMPKASSPVRRDEESLEEFRGMVMESWKGLGVVPRYEYLRLLERSEELKKRLEEAEETVRNLRNLLGSKGTGEEATKVLDSWDKVTREAVNAQAELTRTWMDTLGSREKNGKE